MKRILLLLLSLVCFISCDNALEQTNDSLNNNEKNISSDDTFLGFNKELITLSSGIQLHKCDSIYLLEGDIMLTSEQVDLLDKPETRGAVLNEVAKKWPNGIIYYTFEQNFPNYNLVNRAIDHLQTNTGIRLTPRTNQADYVIFRNSVDENSSYLGKIGGAQTIYIAQSTTSYGTVVHEIGHALGLLHEMTRNDRDSYVNIHWDNIIEKQKYNFQKYSIRGFQGLDHGAFDFNSVMMYHSWSFQINDQQPTITTKTGGLVYGGSSLSNGDIATIKFLYGPPYVRVISQREYTYRDEFPGYERYEGYDDFYLYFYSDKQCTQRTTLPQSRHIYQITYVTHGGRNGYNTSKSERVYVVNAGLNEYYIGRTYFEYISEYGNIYTDDYTQIQAY